MTPPVHMLAHSETDKSVFPFRSKALYQAQKIDRWASLGPLMHSLVRIMPGLYLLVSHYEIFSRLFFCLSPPSPYPASFHSVGDWLQPTITRTSFTYLLPVIIWSRFFNFWRLNNGKYILYFKGQEICLWINCLWITTYETWTSG